MNAWIEALDVATVAGKPVVAVTVTGVRGSAPREPGAKMLVTAAETIGTIGGGQLEYECARIAVGMLGGRGQRELRTFPLGSSMGQCCGGVVDVLFEPIDPAREPWLRDLSLLHGRREGAVVVTPIDAAGGGKAVVSEAATFAASGLPAGVVGRARERLVTRADTGVDGGYLFELVAGSDFNIAVFGAGHVGRAVVDVLSRLDCNIRWVDSRRGVFGAVPANVHAVEAGEPALEVAALPAGALFLVMTHSHAIDFDVVCRVLMRRDAAYCGLIGSRSKRRRFEKRLKGLGFADAALAGLTCPIGVAGITGKRPAEIAVAVAAQLLRTREALAADVGYPANVRPLARD